VDTLPTATAGAIHTTVDTVGVTDGIMIDGVMAADGVTMDTTLLVVMADSAMADSVMMADLLMVVDSKGMLVAPLRIQDMAAEAIAADLKGIEFHAQTLSVRDRVARELCGDLSRPLVWRLDTMEPRGLEQ
jgi:hypothetical protein